MNRKLLFVLLALGVAMIVAGLVIVFVGSPCPNRFRNSSLFWFLKALGQMANKPRL